MKSFQNLIPVAAILISLSPLAASATSTISASHLATARSASTVSKMVAANSKGRPGEFAPAASEVAAVTYTQDGFSSTPSPNANGAPIPNGG